MATKKAGKLFDQLMENCPFEVDLGDADVDGERLSFILAIDGDQARPVALLLDQKAIDFLQSIGSPPELEDMKPEKRDRAPKPKPKSRKFEF